MDSGLVEIWCYDDDRNYITLHYNETKFRNACNSFRVPDECMISIPSHKHYVEMFLKFLDNRTIPDKNDDIIELLNISQFCDIPNKGQVSKFCLISLIKKKLIEKYGITWGQLNKYTMNQQKTFAPFDYDTNRYILKNTDELMYFVAQDSIA